MRLALVLASLLVLGVLGLAQPSTPKKDAGRPVLVSAKTLAASCRAIKFADDGDYLIDPSYKGDMSAAGRCMGYVEGVTDEFREAVGSHYYPVEAPRGEIHMLIEAFLKRVAAHPDEEDTVASTVLHEVDIDLLHSCGDCGLGMLFHRRLIY